jgi:hypothetical protein
MTSKSPIAALYVQSKGIYSDVPGVDPYDEKRDARTYQGPHPVIAHPPCARFGKYWSGGPSGKVRYERPGMDGGLFEHALQQVRRYGGVLEHPAGTLAWKMFGIAKPVGGIYSPWTPAGDGIGHTVEVEQGAYGHGAIKPTWLYAVGTDRPQIWHGDGTSTHKWKGSPEDRVRGARGPNDAVELMGKKKRAATPLEFRDMLIGLARSVKR